MRVQGPLSYRVGTVGAVPALASRFPESTVSLRGCCPSGRELRGVEPHGCRAHGPARHARSPFFGGLVEEERRSKKRNPVGPPLRCSRFFLRTPVALTYCRRSRVVCATPRRSSPLPEQGGGGTPRGTPPTVRDRVPKPPPAGRAKVTSRCHLWAKKKENQRKSYRARFRSLVCGGDVIPTPPVVAGFLRCCRWPGAPDGATPLHFPRGVERVLLPQVGGVHPVLVAAP